MSAILNKTDGSLCRQNHGSSVAILSRGQIHLKREWKWWGRNKIRLMDGLENKCPFIINPHYAVLQLTTGNAACLKYVASFSKYIGFYDMHAVFNVMSY